VVWNDGIKKRVQDIVNSAGTPFPAVDFQTPQRRHWFTDFMNADRKGQSVVTGPRGIANAYEQACQEIAKGLNDDRDGMFENPKALLQSLRADFGSLPHTAELVGLKSANGIHKRTVDVHTLEVVEKLKGLPEFGTFPPDYRDRIEIAASLHDIGKGPKSRWASNGGLQKVDPDHPVRAMPMMVEIFTKYVKKIKGDNARFIVKLVCYHDLVGEVLGKGRDENQIVEVAKNKMELDALFAIGKADATSLVEQWWDGAVAAALYERCLVAIQARYGN
jgi:hypothetical protein